MEGKIKVKVQTSGMIVIHQGDSTVTIHSLKIPGFIQDLRLGKRRATGLKPEKISNDDLSYQAENLYTEALLEVLSKFIAEQIKMTLKTNVWRAMIQQCKFTPVT